MSENNEIDKVEDAKSITEQKLEEMASKRLEIKRDFSEHLGIYIVVNAGLFGLNALISLHYLWFLWSVIIWGIGLGCHYVDTIMQLRNLDDRKALKREMDYLRNRLDDDNR